MSSIAQTTQVAEQSMFQKIRGMGFAEIYRRYGTILIFIGIFTLASVVSPTFLTEGNLTNVLRQVVVVSLLACGVTFIIILGHIDVSLGSVLALTGTQYPRLMVAIYIPLIVIVTVLSALKMDNLAQVSNAKGAIREVACMAHVRRKFVDIHRAQGSPIAEEAIARIAQLYVVEKQARGSPPDRRAELRKANAAPVFDDLEVWLAMQMTRISGKSPLAAAPRPAAPSGQR